MELRLGGEGTWTLIHQWPMHKTDGAQHFLQVEDKEVWLVYLLGSQAGYLHQWRSFTTTEWLSDFDIHYHWMVIRVWYSLPLNGYPSLTFTTTEWLSKFDIRYHWMVIWVGTKWTVKLYSQTVQFMTVFSVAELCYCMHCNKTFWKLYKCTKSMHGSTRV